MKSVGDLLKEYLRERGWLTENPYAPLFSSWNQIAGDAMAPHVRLRDVRDGIMIVEADHPGWMQMARMRKDALIAAARRAAPDARVIDIKLFLGASDP